LKKTAFRDTAPCSLVIYRIFRGAYCFHHQGDVLWRGSFLSVGRFGFGKCRWRAEFKNSGLKSRNIVTIVFEKVNTCKLNYLPHRNKIFIKVWALQKYLIQELAHQCDVRNCLAEKISSTFGSNLVVPIIKIDFKCSCDNEVRYLDLTYFSELRHSKEAARRFLVAVQRTYAFPRHV